MATPCQAVAEATSQRIVMQILITTSVARQPKIIQFSASTLALTALALTFPIMLASLLLYHAVLLKAAHEHWPVISQAVAFVERQQWAQRDRYMHENLDAMATRVGEMQARLMRLEAINERLAQLAGMHPQELQQLQAAPASAAGGPLPHWRDPPASAAGSSDDLLQALNQRLADLEIVGERQSDVQTLIESHLYQSRLDALTLPSMPPVGGPVGSGFGFRTDPFTGRPALHTGLDFPAEIGTPIHAAAGGVVLSAGPHPQYGQLVELDHGNGLITRYAHTSRMLVQVGQLVKRGDVIAEVGSTGRSTGPHLHFEVLVEGVQQDPSRFLARAGSPSSLPRVAPANVRDLDSGGASEAHPAPTLAATDPAHGGANAAKASSP